MIDGHTHTHTHTHRQTQATTIPEGHNWPRVKMMDSLEKNHIQSNCYGNSKYIKIISGFHATFFATCI